MDSLTKMIRIEIVIPGREAASVRDLITSAGATGYTSVSGVSGLGHHGPHSGALLFNDYDTLTMLITVLPPEKALALINALRQLLEGGPGVMFVADTYVSRPEYFA
ncbi:transcriptional regulator [Cryobacterium sp. CG_9.6]|uniref:P-II family nitrogen regulator n=1 Tax=Cryobacterium sp. CG_9.6 TaxID=2760710 RepID=UPI0024758576|nr:transcriptional regulator [Cryobacterium sp. CG_9.6]MDH6238322.1 nitrogen regulatory protein PII [Cryobacterium sp. CG_9.6]